MASIFQNGNTDKTIHPGKTNERTRLAIAPKIHSVNVAVFPCQ